MEIRGSWLRLLTVGMLALASVAAVPSAVWSQPLDTPAVDAESEVSPPPPAVRQQKATPAAPEAQKAPLPVALPGFTADVRQSVERLPLELARLQKATDRIGDDSEGLAQVRTEAEQLQQQTQAALARLEPLLPQIKSQIDRLGPVPKEGEPQESAGLADERQKLNATFSEIDGAIKRLRLTEVRTTQLMSRLQSTRHSLLARDLLSRSPSALSQGVWTDVAQRAPTVWRQLQAAVGSWLRLLGENAILVAAILVATALGYLVALSLREMFVRAIMRRSAPSGEPLGFFKRTRLAALLAPAFAAPRTAAATVLGGGIALFGLYNRLIDQILVASLIAFLLYVAIAALSRAVLMPHSPAYRVVGVGDRAARRLSLLVRLMALVYGLDLVAAAVIQTLYLPQSFGVVAGFIANVLFAALMIAITAVPEDSGEVTEGGQLMSHALTLLRAPVTATALVIVVSSGFGFLPLGRFIATQVMVLGAGGLGLFLLHRAIAALTDESPPADASPRAGGASPGRLHALLQRTRLSRITKAVLNTAIGALAIIALLLSWGFSSSDIATWVRTVVVGFEVGQIRVSPARILLALALLAGIIAATRLIQRWLSTNVLTSRQMDAGLANSIDTGVGYAGTALAVLAAVSYAGLDITNLAIVAGALSVGIGFGLQSIVGNFVSGLILLVERPIKVGDWIVVGGYEGYVRRISVRATEIETFDRASLILPNSELITGTVQNWTHRNAMGRVVVPVGASYSSDPEQVLKVLDAATASCASLLKYPAPFISFDNLGDSALEFTVRAFVADVNKSLAAKTELRIAIVREFRKAGLEIPFPQQDIHLRDLDGIKAMLSRSARKTVDAAEVVDPKPAGDGKAQPGPADRERDAERIKTW